VQFARVLEAAGLGLRLGSHDLRELASRIVQIMDRFSEQHPVRLTAADRPVMVRAGAVEVSGAIDGDHAVLKAREAAAATEMSLG
jgi:hypothetical protein